MPEDDFLTTHWTIVRLAAGDNPAARLALEELCCAYWPPVYAFMRRRGHDQHEASDLTQDFFTRCLERNDFGSLDPSRGKFRAFLIAAAKHFLANEYRRSSAIKRGGGWNPVTLDWARAEEIYGLQDHTQQAPDYVFERRWAETVLEQAAIRVRTQYEREGRAALYAELNPFLSTTAVAGDYVAIATRLSMTSAAIAKAVERLRRRYAEMIRAEIRRTVDSVDNIEQELSDLLAILTVR